MLKHKGGTKTTSRVHAIGRPCILLPVTQVHVLTNPFLFVFFKGRIQCSSRPKPSLPCCLAKKNPEFWPRSRSPPPHTPCCKLTLDKKLELDPKASFRDNENDSNDNNHNANND